MNSSGVLGTAQGKVMGARPQSKGLTPVGYEKCERGTT